MSAKDVVVACLDAGSDDSGEGYAPPVLIATYGDAAVRLAIVVGGVRIEATVSREGWGRIVRGDAG